jgi:hypothetical protein
MLDEAKKLLVKCEAELRALVAQAADVGDYDAVMRITYWAKNLALMTGASHASTIAQVRNARPAATSSKRTSATYPRFGKRGDQLVKIGWSKKDKSQYEHKAPRHVASVLADAVLKAGSDGRIFQVADLLPRVAPPVSPDVPGYQVYIVIAWWRSAALLDQHGRQGYSIPRPKEFAAAIEYAWQSLANI